MLPNQPVIILVEPQLAENVGPRDDELRALSFAAG